MSITMAAREVVAFGAPFRPLHEDFSDPGVAGDFISALRAKTEPLVLRVSVVGRDWFQASAWCGDWLCEADGSEPRRLREPNWSRNEHARDGASEREWIDAWEGCENASWVLNELPTLGVDWRSALLAACDCARLALPYAPRGDDRPLRAVEAAEALARGEAARADARRAAAAADEAADEAANGPEDAADGGRASHACRACACAALSYSALSSYASGRGAEYAGHMTSEAAREAMAAMAGRARIDALMGAVRRRIAALEVLRAAAE